MGQVVVLHRACPAMAQLVGQASSEARKAIGWFLCTTLKARFNGDYKRSPFFNPTTGAPIAMPRVLTSDPLS